MIFSSRAHDSPPWRGKRRKNLAGGSSPRDVPARSLYPSAASFVSMPASTPQSGCNLMIAPGARLSWGSGNGAGGVGNSAARYASTLLRGEGTDGQGRSAISPARRLRSGTAPLPVPLPRPLIKSLRLIGRIASKNPFQRFYFSTSLHAVRIVYSRHSGRVDFFACIDARPAPGRSRFP